MDRTKDWLQAVDQACGTSGISQNVSNALKARALLGQGKSRKGPFMTSALSLLNTIRDLREFINLHQEGYQSLGAYSENDKDQIELEVGSLVKQCQQQVEQLKNSLLTAQRQRQQQQAQHTDEQGQQQGTVNEQTIAHLHGVVLYLAEQLHAVSSRFDKCRATRYTQLAEREEKLKKHLQTASSIVQSANNTIEVRNTGKQKDRSFPDHAPGRPGSRSGSYVPKTNSEALLAATRLGGVVFSHVKGVTETVLGAAASQITGRPYSSSPVEEQEADSGNSDGSVDGNDAGTGLPSQKSSSLTKRASPQKQVQAQIQAESHDLALQLQSTALAVHDVERTIREIATLNQMFSTAVLSQAETIQAIYDDAVQASLNLKKGNVEIKKTIEANKSARKYILVLLIAATLGLLFFDWINS